MADAYLTLRVTDPDLDMIYIREQLVRIRSPFTKYGWMVLSEQGGYSNLTYLRESIGGTDPANPSEIEIPGDGIKHYYTFDGNIVGMNAESYRSERMIVGLDNNKIVIMNTNNANNAKNTTEDARKVYWKLDHDFGRIVDQKYKVGKAIP